MANSEPQGGAAAADFESLARQYWNAWGDALRSASPDAGAQGAQALQDAIGRWARMAQGQAQPGAADDVVGRLDAQARQWYAQMQQVAAQFAGRDGSAADVVDAWKRALGAAGVNPFPEMFRSMRGPGLHDFEHWMEQAAPLLRAWRAQGSDLLDLPTFGFAREHQERWQRLVQAQLELQQRTEAYNALMLKASQQAYALLERRLAEREQPGLQIESPRALFDLWIEAAEEAYAEVALSPEFRDAYGHLVNAQMRVRGAVQREVEQLCRLFDMPTRSELDGAHRKIVELERQVRRLRDAVVPSSSASPEAVPPRKPAGAAKAGKPRKSAARSSRPAAAKRTAKAAPGKPAAREAPPQAAGAGRRVTTRPSQGDASSPARRAAGRAKRSASAVTGKPSSRSAAMKKTTRSKR
ncbi:class III poly(R)-hydroxyalkanoic acid synthase subunit PhaE [Luteimonas sp. R10]|uniref:class III poly(R)-hydroxyalkanoic acid synthase subunit PhaE n=1 Tax=Luteimonas sp. R10 TaxID=3108176 RepID=UPI00308AE818|nr:class III poly(R)-hydroxyalkanoic acid synthase subunit PhaE [Luteimonas sp. R10]